MKTIDVSREAFNTSQASQIIEATPRQIRYWDKIGLVKPSIRSAMGKGSRRLFSYKDLLALQTVKQFLDEGLTLQRVGKCVQFLRKKLPEIIQPLGFCRLISSPDTIHLVTDKSNLMDTVMSPGQYRFSHLVDIAGLEHDLRRKVIAMSVHRVEEVAVGDFSYQVEVEADVDEGGYVATVAGLPGCITDGDTLQETLANAKDAIEGWLEAHEDLKRQGIHVSMKPQQRKRIRA
ncbi:MAG: MerR family transcriptional regulator [Planctomycetaceae bacterium]|nr:MerR family transcriptional regulator [Planctomycetaceae bacterium]